jgi:hypothetical protein
LCRSREEDEELLPQRAQRRAEDLHLFYSRSQAPGQQTVGTCIEIFDIVIKDCIADSQLFQPQIDFALNEGI